MGATQPINMMVINSNANIIVGKSVELKISTDQSDIFDAILSKYPTLLHYIHKSNSPDMVKLLIQQLNTIYDYLERQSSDSFDVTQLENQRIRNRINFFSSIPTQHPQSMIPGVASSSNSSDDEDDDDLLSQLQIMANLGPIDIDSESNRPILSTQLKPAGQGIGRLRKENRLIHAEKIPATHQPIGATNESIFGSLEQMRIMNDLNDEFGDDVAVDFIDDDEEPPQPCQEDDDDEEENIGSGEYD